MEVFQELFYRAKHYLKNGENVVIDATNIAVKRRIAFNHNFKSYNREIIYFNTSFSTCVKRNAKRLRKVPYEVMLRMFKGLQIPIQEEGWDKITRLFGKSC